MFSQTFYITKRFEMTVNSSLIGTALLPYNYVVITSREVEFGESEHYMHLQYMPRISVISRNVSLKMGPLY